MEKFRREIAQLKELELLKKERGEKYDPHFENIDPLELNDVDRVTFMFIEAAGKLSPQTVSEDRLEVLRNFFHRYQGLVSTSGVFSRQTFAAHLANRATAIFGQIELALLRPRPPTNFQ